MTDISFIDKWYPFYFTYLQKSQKNTASLLRFNCCDWPVFFQEWIDFSWQIFQPLHNDILPLTREIPWSLNGVLMHPGISGVYTYEITSWPGQNVPGGTPLFKPYRYVLPQGYGFCAVLVWRRVWFSRELRQCMNVFIVSIQNERGRKRNMRIRNGIQEIFFGAVVSK